MPTTLASIRDRVETHLSDSSNLTYGTDVLDEAIRSALAEISIVQGEALTLSGLDTAGATTLPALDDFALVIGAVAYALSFRMTGRAEDALPQAAEPDTLTAMYNRFRSHFDLLLNAIKRRLLQSSADHPYSEWDWDEDYLWDED
jgi:hypothetical protein